MSKDSNSKHHWWPKKLQARYWSDSTGRIFWAASSGIVESKNPLRGNTARKQRGHKILAGKAWETNFENDFDIDNKMHEIVGGLQNLVSLSGLSYACRNHCMQYKQKAEVVQDFCRFHQMDEALHRNLLEFLLSLLIRSPARRERYNHSPELLGLSPNEEVGKVNMKSAYYTAKALCRSGSIRNQFFVILHSPSEQFVYGDGCLDWLTDSLTGNQLDGKALVPLTPDFCVYFCTPLSMRSTYNCACIAAEPWMIKRAIQITQVYAKE